MQNYEPGTLFKIKTLTSGWKIDTTKPSPYSAEIHDVQEGQYALLVKKLPKHYNDSLFLVKEDVLYIHCGCMELVRE